MIPSPGALRVAIALGLLCRQSLADHLEADELFQITKQNARVPDPNNSAFNILAGSQQVRGFELGATGSLTEAWRIYAGYAYLDSQVTSSSSAAVATVGALTVMLFSDPLPISHWYSLNGDATPPGTAKPWTNTT